MNFFRIVAHMTVKVTKPPFQQAFALAFHDKLHNFPEGEAHTLPQLVISRMIINQKGFRANPAN
jgi:hypothetical protein